MKNETQLVRFVTELEHLIDDIKNGFKLSKHEIIFESTEEHNLLLLLDFWNENNINDGTIQKIRELRSLASNDEDFFNLLADTRTNDRAFNASVMMYISAVSFNQEMKSFTEVRHNQKIHPHHTGFFGNYGISLTKEWGIRNNASQVIYLETDSQLSKRIGLILAMLKSSWSIGRTHHHKAIFDLLALVEHSEHSFEFEWRILGRTNVMDPLKSIETQRIPFGFSDIIAIYVKDTSEISKLEEVLKELKKNSNDTGDIPQILLTKSIILSENEINEIKNIHERR